MGRLGDAVDLPVVGERGTRRGSFGRSGADDTARHVEVLGVAGESATQRRPRWIPRRYPGHLSGEGIGPAFGRGATNRRPARRTAVGEGRRAAGDPTDVVCDRAGPDKDDLHVIVLATVGVRVRHRDGFGEAERPGGSIHVGFRHADVADVAVAPFVGRRVAVLAVSGERAVVRRDDADPAGTVGHRHPRIGPGLRGRGRGVGIQVDAALIVCGRGRRQQEPDGHRGKQDADVAQTRCRHSSCSPRRRGRAGYRPISWTIARHRGAAFGCDGRARTSTLKVPNVTNRFSVAFERPMLALGPPPFRSRGPRRSPAPAFGRLLARLRTILARPRSPDPPLCRPPSLPPGPDRRTSEQTCRPARPGY